MLFISIQPVHSEHDFIYQRNSSMLLFGRNYSKIIPNCCPKIHLIILTNNRYKKLLNSIFNDDMQN